MKIKPFLAKILKAVHIAFVSGAVGGFVAILVLMAARTKLDPLVFSGLDAGILRLFTWIITYSSFGLILTSCFYSLFFGWGILRFGWVTAKWLIVFALFVLAWFRLGPAVSGLASISDAGYHVATMADRYRAAGSTIVSSSVIGLVLMVIALFLSTIRPFWRREVENRIEKVISWIILVIVVLGMAMFVMSDISLARYRTMPIKDLSAAGIPDGKYPGEAVIGSFTYNVRVTVVSGRISQISSVERRESIYAEYAEGVFEKIIRRQNPNVSAISGATTTSKAYMKAVENALIKAGAR